MPRESALGLLGGAQGWCTAVSWLPLQAVRGLTWGSDLAGDGQAFAALAQALGVSMAFVPADEVWAQDAVAQLRMARVEAAWSVEGVFGRVARRFGWAQALALTAMEPGEIAAALDEELHEVLAALRRGAGSGARVLVVADDLAGASGWLLSPDYVLEALMPCYRRIAGEWAKTGGLALFHSDGDVRAIMPALRGAGFVGIHIGSAGSSSLEAQMQTARASGLCPIGGVEARALLTQGATDTAQRAVELARQGRLIICDDGGVSNVECAAALTTALRLVPKLI